MLARPTGFPDLVDSSRNSFSPAPSSGYRARQSRRRARRFSRGSRGHPERLFRAGSAFRRHAATNGIASTDRYTAMICTKAGHAAASMLAGNAPTTHNNAHGPVSSELQASGAAGPRQLWNVFVHVRSQVLHSFDGLANARLQPWRPHHPAGPSAASRGLPAITVRLHRPAPPRLLLCRPVVWPEQWRSSPLAARQSRLVEPAGKEGDCESKRPLSPAALQILRIFPLLPHGRSAQPSADVTPDDRQRRESCKRPLQRFRMRGMQENRPFLGRRCLRLRPRRQVLVTSLANRLDLAEASLPLVQQCAALEHGSECGRPDRHLFQVPFMQRLNDRNNSCI